jgi:(2R)-3-sulfolactate dehydrogenase (NADP+)
MVTVHREELAELCKDALLRAGAEPRAAQVLAAATVEAELVGNRAVGVAHLFDYLDAYRAGRIAVDRRRRPQRARSDCVRRGVRSPAEGDARSRDCGAMD